MDSLKQLICLALVGCLLAATVLAEEGNDVVSSNAKEANGGGAEPRFLEGLFDGMDMKIEKFVSQGQSVVKQVQTMQGSHGGTKIIKTEITESFGHPGMGMRFKRDLFSGLEGMMSNIENKVASAKDKVAGKVSDAVNIGYEVHNKVNKVFGDRHHH